uniref:Scavenger receptor class B n=1 Tax=Anopheles atroparvus TaxID=41427 RepID=A0AAG5DVV4_ANOAO
MRCCQWYFVLGLGLGIAATGVIFLLSWRDIFDILVTEEKSLIPGSTAYKEWRRPMVHPSWQFYVYNWTNAASYLEHPDATSASFRQLGPFTYDEHTEVVDAKYHARNGTLSYRKRIYFRRHPVERFSGGALQHANITSINFAALLISFLSQSMDYPVQRELSFLLHDLHQSVTSTRTIGQLLFSGYRSPLWDQARTIVCPRHHIGVLCSEERLAYFRTYNVTRKASETYSLNIGLEDRALYGVVQSWSQGSRGKETATACKSFEGYTGDLFPSRLDRTQPLALVLPEFCLRLSLEYERDEIVGDIVGYRYVAKVVGALNGEEKCNESTSNVHGYGTLISNDCQRIPLYRYGSQENMHTMEPLKETIYFVLEPATGTVLESYIAMKYHTLLVPNAHIALFQDVPELYVPLFRFVRYYRLSDTTARNLTKMLHLLDVGHQIALAGCALGGAIVLLTIMYAFWNGRKSNDKPHQRKLNVEYRIVGTQLSNGGTVH